MSVTTNLHHTPDEDNLLNKIEISALDGVYIEKKDWTVETVYSQIMKGNIDLAPDFQRRNAWNDELKSGLIESYILNYPISPITLAEYPKDSGRLIVLDGKQRLSTIAGFINPKKFKTWDKPKLQDLKVLNKLNGLRYSDLDDDSLESSVKRHFENAAVPCHIVRNLSNYDVLYDIFIRLNTSVPLNMQELRQVFYRGDCTLFLKEITDTEQPIHKVLGIEAPDSRFNDIEIILKNISNKLFGNEYKSSLSKFLDLCLDKMNKNWSLQKKDVESAYSNFNKAINNLALGYGKLMGLDSSSLFGLEANYKLIGTIPNKKRVFNKALFEVEVYYFSFLEEDKVLNSFREFEDNLKELCDKKAFFKSITLGTNSIGSYRSRFIAFQGLMTETFNLSNSDLPLPFELDDNE